MEENFRERARVFIADMVSALKNNGLLEDLSAIDHVCYRVPDSTEYASWKARLHQLGELLTEAPVNGRPISTFLLKEPLYEDSQFKVDVIELPAPKPGHKAQNGFDHIEAVTKRTLEEFLQRNSGFAFETKNLSLKRNREISIRFECGIVKFHEKSLAEIIEEEKAEAFCGSG